MVNELSHAGNTVYFVADDMGMPFSPGYPTREQAEQVAELIESSDGNATLPSGVDVEAMFHASRKS